jgi:hypothetical protein
MCAIIEKFLIFFGSYLKEDSALSAGDFSFVLIVGAAYAVELRRRTELVSGHRFRKRELYRTPHADIMDDSIIQNLRHDMVVRICISGGSCPCFVWNQQPVDEVLLRTNPFHTELWTASSNVLRSQPPCALYITW